MTCCSVKVGTAGAFRMVLDNAAGQFEALLAERDTLLAENRTLRMRCDDIKRQLVPPAADNAEIDFEDEEVIDIDDAAVNNATQAPKQFISDTTHKAFDEEQVKEVDEGEIESGKEDHEVAGEGEVSEQDEEADCRTREKWHHGQADAEQQQALKKAMREASDRRASGTQEVSLLSPGRGAKGKKSCLIHPQSKMALFRDILVAIFAVLDVAIAPLPFLWQPSNNRWHNVVFIACIVANTFWTYDVLFQLRSSFYRGGKLVATSAEVVKHYMMSWFVYDFMMVALEWFHLESMGSQRAVEFRVACRFGLLLRVLRVLKIRNSAKDFLSLNFNMLVGARFAFNFAIFLGALHIAACVSWAMRMGKNGGLMTIVEAGTEIEEEGYIASLAWAVSHLGGGAAQPTDTTAEQLCSISLAFVCLVFVVLLVSSTTSTLQGHSRFNVEENDEQAVGEFLRRNNVSRSEASQIQRGVVAESRHRRQREQDKEAMVLLPPHQVKHIMMQVRAPTVVENSRFFDFLKTNFNPFFRDMCFTVIELDLAWEGETLFSVGEVCQVVRCVKSGLLNYTAGGRPSRTAVELDKIPGDRPIGAHQFISEVGLWVNWKHMGSLQVAADCENFNFSISEFERVVSVNMSVHGTIALYAQQFCMYLNQEQEERSDLIALPPFYWDDEHFDARLVGTHSVPLPWLGELPAHVTQRVCVAAVQMARMVACDGLDENRPHHGFTVIVGDARRLESCGGAGFNPFNGNSLHIVGSNGCLDTEVFDILRRNAFNTDGAIVVDGASGKVVASGWFVSDISLGGKAGGARSRSAKAIAQQAGYCYVAKGSEDSSGELLLHLGKRSQKFDHPIEELPAGDTKMSNANTPRCPAIFTISSADDGGRCCSGR